MRLSAIVAMSENRVIGKENRLPWHLPADLRYFKKITQHHAILMGRNTYESIGRPLPNRFNIVVTRDTKFEANGCLVVNSIDKGLAAVADRDEVFVIGGATLYQQMLPQLHRLYITLIHHAFEGDTYFPDINMTEWSETERIDCVADEHNPYGYSFIVLDRKAC